MAQKQDREAPKTGLDRWNATESKSRGSKGGRAARPGRSKRRRMNPTVRRYVSTIVVTAVLCVACAFCFTPLGERITTGLDIQGGVSVILTASKQDGSAPSTDEMNTAKTIVEKRVNTLGASEATVQIQGNNSILVQIPGATDADAAVQTIGQTGHLEFVRLDDIGDADALAKIEAGASNVTLEQGTYTSFLDGSYIESTSVAQSSTSVGTYAVNITFNSEGADIFDKVTKELAPTNGQICIVLDGVVQSAPAVQEEISGGKVSITGNFTSDQAQELKTVLDSGSLPVSLNYSESRVVGPTLGQDSLNQGILALVIGVAIVIVYLFFFYRGLGLLTLGSLVVFAILYLGLLAILSRYGMFSLSLPGLAGMVLTTGSAADSSILVLERFREEIRMGRTVKNASVSGARHGIMTSLDADIVTLVTALALFFVGTGTVKGFGLTLALGVACDIVTMFGFKAPALRLLAAHVIPSHPGFWGVDQDIAEAERKSQEAQKARGAKAPTSSAKGVRLVRSHFSHEISFIGHRKQFLTLSCILVILSIVGLAVRGLVFGIEFTGGTEIDFYQTGDITIEQMRDALAATDEGTATVQTTTTQGEAGFLVRSDTTDPTTANAHAQAAAESLGLTSDNYTVTTIGPDWGADTTRSSLMAFGVAILLIIAYVSFRYEFKMSITAVVALIHDLVITLGVYAWFQIDISPNVIAALLTIMGYSLYDTVVEFNRMNENAKQLRDGVHHTYFEICNFSINEVIVRTINTTIVTLVPVVCMLAIGGATLKDFAFAILVGEILGTYSSFAVASPLLAIWKTREPKWAKLEAKYGSAAKTTATPADGVEKNESKED